MKVIQVLYGYTTVVAFVYMVIKILTGLNFNIWIFFLAIIFIDVRPLKYSNYPFGFSLRPRFQILN